MIGGFMNVLKKVLLFIVLALAIAWPLQPQRAGRQDRERELKPPADTNRASALAAPAQWARGYFYNSNLSCYATVIKQTTEGGYIMAGYEYYVDMTSRAWSAFVVKLNADGIVEWQTRLENSETSYGMWPIPLVVFQSADCGSIIGGAGWGYWVIKLSASGAFQWQRHKIVWGYPECFMLFDIARPHPHQFPRPHPAEQLYLHHVIYHRRYKWHRDFDDAELNRLDRSTLTDVSSSFTKALYSGQGSVSVNRDKAFGHGPLEHSRDYPDPAVNHFTAQVELATGDDIVTVLFQVERREVIGFFIGEICRERVYRILDFLCLI